MYLVTSYIGHKNATNFIIDYDSQLFATFNVSVLQIINVNYN
jgi:hypothetical protein